MHGWNVAAPALGAGLLWAGQPWPALGLLGSAHAAWLAATVWPNARWSGRVLGHRGVTAAASPDQRADHTAPPPRLWLTIDDGPCRADHQALLNLLDQAGVRVSAFVIGHRAAADPALVDEWHAAGHRLENHTWSHRSASTWCAGPGRARDEIDRCQDWLAGRTGRSPCWFRAPAGLANPWLHAAAERRGLATLAWTARGLDGIASNPAQVARRIRRRWHPGGIVLIHQGLRGGRQGSAAPEVLRRVLETAREDGYEWMTPDQGLRLLGLGEPGPPQ